VVERGTPYTSILLMVEKEYILHIHTAETICLDFLWPFTQGMPGVFWPNTLESPKVAHFSIFRRFFFNNLGKEANPWGTPWCYFPRLDPGEI
jgi:hypothetical protein